MRFTGLCFAVLFTAWCLASGYAVANDNAESVPLHDLAGAGSAAEPDAPPSPMLTDAPPPYDVSLKDAISADLIDLSGLRAALDRPVEAQVLRLTLEEAIHIALQNNPDIIIAQFEPEKAEAETFAAHGEFDPVVQQSLNYARSKTSLDQTTRRFVGFLGTGFPSVDMKQISSETALAGKLQYGTQYAVQFAMDYQESTFGGYQGEYGGTLGFTLTQPVLRGYGRNINRVRIRGGRNLRKISEAQARLTVLNKAAETIKAYWDLVGATEAARVYEEALRNAERLLKISETRRDIGTAADIDVLQAKAGVAMRQSELIQAYARISDASDMLKLLLNLEEEGRFSKITVLPLDRPNPEFGGLFDVDNFEASLDLSVQRALELRPENDMSDLELENAALEEERARNDMLPQVDLVGAYARGGRDRTLGRTLSGILEEQDRNFAIGVQATVPIGNRAARGAHQRARLNKRQAEERRKQTQMALMMRTHHAARSVMTSRALVESNQQTVRLQEANVNAEERRLRIGITTSYLVLRVQEDLTAAQAQDLQARISFEKSLVDLQLAEGSLLDNLGVIYSPEISDTPVSWLESIGLSR